MPAPACYLRRAPLGLARAVSLLLPLSPSGLRLACFVLNCILVFLVLFYVNSLKFLFTFLVNMWMGFARRRADQGPPSAVALEIFSAGFLAVSCIFMLLYGHAPHRPDALELNALEVFDTKVSIGAGAINGFTAIASLVIAWLAPIHWSGSSGVIYPILFARALRSITG
jgi:hypothetical protein